MADVPVPSIEVVEPSTTSTVLGVVAGGQVKNLQAGPSFGQLAAVDGAEKLGTPEGTVQEALDGRLTKSEAAAADGATKVGTDAPVAVPYLQTLSDVINGNPVSLYRFMDDAKILAMRGFSTTYDAAPRIQDAFTSGARRLVAEYGLYNMESSVVSLSPIVIDGAGVGSIINQVSITDKASFKFKSSADGVFIEGLRISRVAFRCLTGTFFEQQHLLEMDGVRDVLIDDVLFYGFRGDAIYLGAGTGVDQRHNENVRITNSTFDGVNNANRNAISVVDGDGIWIDHNRFLRCTQTAGTPMPGPIDFEPNANAWHILRNVTVEQNRFRACGGNVGEIGVPVPSAVTAAPRNFLIRDNDSDGYVGTGSFFSWNTQRTPTSSSDDGQIQVIGNHVRNGNRPFSYYDGNGITHERNVWQDMKQAAFLADPAGATSVRNGLFKDEKFIRCGNVGKVGLSVFNATLLNFKNQEFADCGTGAAGSYAIDFGAGSSSQISFDGLRVTAPTAKTLVAIQKEAGHTFDAPTNSFFNSDVGALTNNFLAQFSDALETTYTPVVAGSTVAGAGTYTTQFGRFMRVGKRCFVRIKVVLTAHTGTGILQIGLPIQAKQSGGTAESLFGLQVDGAVSTGGQIALLNQGVTVNSVLGALRCYSQGTGTLTTLLVPAGASTIYVNGSYLTD
jgi:hypothetical protein